MFGLIEIFEKMVARQLSYYHNTSVMADDVMGKFRWIRERFNYMISSPDYMYALCHLLGEHDDSFNRDFLTFLSAAWSKRQSTGLLSA